MQNFYGVVLWLFVERRDSWADSLLVHTGQRDRSTPAAPSSAREDVHANVDVRQDGLRQRARQSADAVPRSEATSS